MILRSKGQHNLGTHSLGKETRGMIFTHEFALHVGVDVGGQVAVQSNLSHQHGQVVIRHHLSTQISKYKRKISRGAKLILSI
jgi:hypothetical protein